MKPHGEAFLIASLTSLRGGGGGDKRMDYPALQKKEPFALECGRANRINKNNKGMSTV